MPDHPSSTMDTNQEEWDDFLTEVFNDPPGFYSDPSMRIRRVKRKKWQPDLDTDDVEVEASTKCRLSTKHGQE